MTLQGFLASLQRLIAFVLLIWAQFQGNGCSGWRIIQSKKPEKRRATGQLAALPLEMWVSLGRQCWRKQCTARVGKVPSPLRYGYALSCVVGSMEKYGKLPSFPWWAFIFPLIWTVQKDSKFLTPIFFPRPPPKNCLHLDNCDMFCSGMVYIARFGFYGCFSH